MKKSWRVALLACGALSLYLVMEAFLPADSQPSAKAGVALLHAYQATGSHAMKSTGVQCRYTPTCSHYAEDAIAHYGTLNGVAKTAGRLWRCSPWGGAGYDPAVEPRSVAYLSPQQETPEDRKAREEAQKAADQFKRDMEKFRKEMPKEAGEAAAACGVGCVLAIISAAVGVGILVFMMVFTYKDAKARGDQNAVLWLVLIFFLHWIGFIIYMVARPKGELTPCPNCKQRKLDILTKCPHCAADLGSGAAAPPAPPKT